ncbi:MAG: hypothetical protein M3P96_04715 [Actinomycetota bacterium]|nr:hypothetical protein [Actinomycetota bacterium]
MAEQRELSTVVGRQLRTLRTESATIGNRIVSGLTQEDVARGMRECGFPWRRDAVAQVERGTRRLTIEELAGLTYVLHSYQVDGASQLVPPGEQIELARGWKLSGRQVRALLTGAADEVEGPIRPLEAVEIDDAATRVAGRLGVHRVLVAEAAHALYGQPLGAERDAEVAARGEEEMPTDPAAQRRVAGAITRRLVDEELVPYLEGRVADARSRAEARREGRRDHVPSTDHRAGRPGEVEDDGEEG